MRKPVVCHFILDGFCPSNKENFYDNFKKIWGDYHTKCFVSPNPHVGIPHSPEFWTMIYSHHSFSDLRTPEDSPRIGMNSLVRRIPSESFLWNKISSQGFPSWLHLYGQYYYMMSDNLISEEAREYISGVVKFYGDAGKTCKVDNGELQYYKSPYNHYGLHEVTTPGNTELKELYSARWKNIDEDFLHNFPAEIKTYFDENYRKLIDANYKVYEEEFFPSLRNHAPEYKVGGYVCLGMVETDGPYHFLPIYQGDELIQYLSDYVHYVLETTISILNPDIVIITGDHGMESVKDAGIYDKTYAFHYKDNVREGNKSYWEVAPVYTEHNHEIGALFMTKDANYLNLFEKDYWHCNPYFMYDVYDYISDLFGKDTSNE